MGVLHFGEKEQIGGHGPICRRSFSIIPLSWNEPLGSFER